MKTGRYPATCKNISGTSVWIADGPPLRIRIQAGWDVTSGGATDEPILRAGCRREAMRGVHECKRADHGHRPDCRGKDWSLQGNREVGREGTYPVSRLSAPDNDVGCKIADAVIGWRDERDARPILRSNPPFLSH